MAQTVYSVNAVGYVKIGPIAPNAFFLAANPLTLPTNSLAAVLPDAPANTKVYVLSGGAFSVFTKRTTGWTGTGADTATLDPGMGFFIQNGTTTDLTITFVGEVMQGTVTTAYPAGFSLLGSKIPQAGKVEADLGLVAANGDVLYQLVGGSYVLSTRRATNWTPSEPIVDVGNGFFFNAKAAGTWSRTFSVNP
jgi:hypothetical protein